MRRKSPIVAGLTILGLLLMFGVALAEVRYHYDDLNRLIRVECEDGTNILYSYDELGNRLSRVVGTDTSAPDSPSGPSFPSGAVNTPLSLDLAWTGGDPDGDGLTYTLFLDKNSHPTTQVATGPSPTFHVQGLDCGSTYYWSVKSVDQHGAVTQGPIWHFTTNPGAPVKNQRSNATYTSLGDAYRVALDGDTLLVQNLRLVENFNADRNITVTINGGYSCLFVATPIVTVFKGAHTISRGTVTMKNILISN